MTAGFDWSLIHSEEWTALSAFGDAPQHVSRGLYRVAPGIFAMTDGDEGVPSNPGVGAILWAVSDEVALLIYDHALPRSDRRGPVYPPPPPDVLGFEPLTYAAARAYERQRSDGPLGEFASYGRLDGDGAHRTTSFRGVGRKYYFREVNPEGEASIIAVKFTVSPIPGVLSRQPHVDYVVEYLDAWRRDDPTLARLGNVLRSAEMQFPEGAPWSGEVGSVLRHALDAVDRIDETTSGEERITALADHLETLRATLATAPPV